VILRKLVLTDFQSCCYLLASRAGSAAAVIDPGGEPERITSALEQGRLTPEYIINTHGHADHTGANRALKLRFPQSKICIHPGDQAMLGDPDANLSAWFGGRLDSPPADVLLEEDDRLEVEGLTLRVIHVPGHTPGSICMFLEQQPGPLLFSGDALFDSGIGRTDFPGGNYGLLVAGIREKLFTLPDCTRVLPGHGPETTIGEEKQNNPFCKPQ
jgi:glyoxylase-like metal-dependent hydrolase (beta-lactamase superfamily II)